LCGRRMPADARNASDEDHDPEGEPKVKTSMMMPIIRNGAKIAASH